ncbi:TPA: hypothetical protein U0P88_001282 [Legionella pneumophila]|nr:hypothetical protein [Legionella pneumophila]HBD7265888.1 hypothetical protein [Legionella pneumophila]HBD7271495.1 hypothetical protein [Legionella pneumophila]HBD7338454.1 hypothetical protein [Legionella pneumophila]HBD7405054.1 hypothetical protein [Legionella pneumophila]
MPAQRLRSSNCVEQFRTAAMVFWLKSAEFGADSNSFKRCNRDGVLMDIEIPLQLMFQSAQVPASSIRAVENQSIPYL